MANVVLKWLGNKLFNGTKMICSLHGNNVKVDKTNLGSLIDVNTEELEEDVERALLGNHVYSTTERVCGEWIDGRNIVEKTIVVETPFNMTRETWVDVSSKGVPVADIVLHCKALRTNKEVGTPMMCNCDYWIEDGTQKIASCGSTVSNIDTIIIQYVLPLE